MIIPPKMEIQSNFWLLTMAYNGTSVICFSNSQVWGVETWKLSWKCPMDLSGSPMSLQHVLQGHVIYAASGMQTAMNWGYLRLLQGASLHRNRYTLSRPRKILHPATSSSTKNAVKYTVALPPATWVALISGSSLALPDFLQREKNKNYQVCCKYQTILWSSLAPWWFVSANAPWKIWKLHLDILDIWKLITEPTWSKTIHTTPICQTRYW